MEIVIITIVALLLFGLIFWGYITLVKQQRDKADAHDRKRYFSLESSHKLFAEEKYDLAVIDAFKSLEIALKKKFPSVQTERGSAFELLTYAEEKGYLNRNQIDKAHFARMQRNQIVHSRGEMSKDTAAEVISAVRQVIEGLKL